MLRSAVIEEPGAEVDEVADESWVGLTIVSFEDASESEARDSRSEEAVDAGAISGDDERMDMSVGGG